MPSDRIISLIDEQIVKLQEVRTALVSLGKAPQTSTKGRGRPKGSTNKNMKAVVSAPKKPEKPAKRTMSAEGKARIAEAQRQRWAAQRQAAEPATRKYAVETKAAKKTTIPEKKTLPPELQLTAEAPAADA